MTRRSGGVRSAAPEPRAADARGRIRRVAPASVLAVAATAVVLLWVPLATMLCFPARNDELGFHLPTVRRFADHFPTFHELSRPALSFLPLFHGVLGFLSRFVGTSDQALRGLMIPIGLAAIVLYGWMIARRLELDWRRAVLALAVFPYFGATYFTVLTDFPAFLGLLVGLFGQLWYLRTGRGSAAWLAAIGGAAACLVRQNLVFSTAVFVVLALLPVGREALARTAGRRRPPPLAGGLLPLILPFLAVALQVWMWKGLMPPRYMYAPNYLDWTPAGWLLNVLSLAADTGYYLFPVSAALAWRDRRTVGPRAWIAMGVLSLAGALCSFWCARLEGRYLISSYGAYSYVLEAVARRCGGPAALLVHAASLCSFGWIARCGWVWMARAPHADLRPALVVVTLAAGYLVLGFGLDRVFERHLLPLYALAVIVLLGGTSAAAGRSWFARLGWTAAILFGLAHSVVYSLHVYPVPWWPGAAR